MPTPEEHNQAVKEEANGKLGELNDKVRKLKLEDVDESGLPNGSVIDDQLDNFKDLIEALIDKAHEAINVYHISEADESLRAIRRRIKITVKDPAKQTLVDLIDAITVSKRKITAPRLELVPNEKNQFISTEDLLRLSASDIYETSLSNLGIPSDRLKLVQSFGFRTVGDLVEWRKSKS